MIPAKIGGDVAHPFEIRLVYNRTAASSTAA